MMEAVEAGAVMAAGVEAVEVMAAGVEAVEAAVAAGADDRARLCRTAASCLA